MDDETSSGKRARMSASGGDDSGGEDESKYTKGTWCKEEDDKLIEAVQAHGIDNWKAVASIVLGRSAKQCRDRYKLKLDPTINHGPWTKAEDDRLLELAAEYGRAWTKIARSMPGRTENAVKSRISSLERSKTKDWSPEEDARLTELRRKNFTFEQMTKHFPGRSSHAIKKRWETLHMDELTRKLKQDLTGTVMPNQQQMPNGIPEAVVLGQPMQPSFVQHMNAAAIQGQIAGQLTGSSLSANPMFAQLNPMVSMGVSSMPKLPNSQAPPVHPAVQGSRLQRHSTSMTVLLQVLGGDSAAALQGSPLKSQASSASTTLKDYSSFSLPGPFPTSQPLDSLLGSSPNEGETPRDRLLRELKYDESRHE